MSYKVEYPDAEFHEILPNLYIGGHFWSEDGQYRGGQHSKISEDESWDYVVSAHLDVDHEQSWPLCDLRLVLFKDTEKDLSDKTWSQIKDAVDSVVDRWIAGQKVLVRCLAGFNRSGLVMALILMRLGFTAEVAIKRLRGRRSPYVLVNPVFEGYVRDREEEYQNEENLYTLVQHAFWSDEKIDRLVRDVFDKEGKYT